MTDPTLAINGIEGLRMLALMVGIGVILGLVAMRAVSRLYLGD